MLSWKTTIKDYAIRGDIHGNINAIRHFCTDYEIANTALIILGDVGFNFYLNRTDKKNKAEVQNMDCLVYCVRGNHEERPENIDTMLKDYDTNIQGEVYYEEQFPNIRYLIDGNIYNFLEYKVLVIGGAYSVDKYHRLYQAQSKGLDPSTHWCGWFKDEQLTENEMKTIFDKVNGQKFDFIFSHTCPYDWQPFDLFLTSVNQANVDNSMEKWMNELKEKITWKYAWCFGHFHADRIVRPHVEMFMNDTELLRVIAQRWRDWDNGFQLDWWLELDPTWPFWEEELGKRKNRYEWSF